MIAGIFIDALKTNERLLDNLDNKGIHSGKPPKKFQTGLAALGIHPTEFKFGGRDAEGWKIQVTPEEHEKLTQKYGPRQFEVTLDMSSKIYQAAEAKNPNFNINNVENQGFPPPKLDSALKTLGVYPEGYAFAGFAGHGGWKITIAPGAMDLLQKATEKFVPIDPPLSQNKIIELWEKTRAQINDKICKNNPDAITVEFDFKSGKFSFNIPPIFHAEGLPPKCSVEQFTQHPLFKSGISKDIIAQLKDAEKRAAPAVPAPKKEGEKIEQK